MIAILTILGCLFVGSIGAGIIWLFNRYLPEDERDVE